MKKFLSVSIAVSFVLVFVGVVFAQKESSREISSDKQQIAEQRQAIKSSVEQARAEESQLKAQINQAIKSGDFKTAGSLTQQLKSTHHENVQQKHQDMKELRAAKKEFRQDVKAARNLPPHVKNNPKRR